MLIPWNIYDKLYFRPQEWSVDQCVMWIHCIIVLTLHNWTLYRVLVSHKIKVYWDYKSDWEQFCIDILWIKGKNKVYFSDQMAIFRLFLLLSLKIHPLVNSRMLAITLTEPSRPGHNYELHACTRTRTHFTCETRIAKRSIGFPLSWETKGIVRNQYLVRQW